MDLIGQQDVDPAYGSFVYKPDVSSCIFLAGNGEFLDGPAATPQIIENGGFVTFSGQSKENVAAFIEETITGNVSKKLKGKIVSKVQFLKSRRLANGHPISLSKIPVQEAPLKRIYTPKPISGFPEWTPEIRDIERQWLEAVAEIFERYGFVNIETPAAEEIAVLADKGEEIERDVYEMKRMNAEDDKDPKIALHYDLTVPMARYVAQHYNELSFPFKRYQIQKVWRGSRPQKGKFREFIQCDIDVVDHCPLSMEFDADFPVILYNLVKRLDIGNIAISVNNRKILEGFYRGLGIDDPQILRAIHVVDKIQKVGEEGVRARLSEELGLSTPKISKCIALAEIRSTDACIKDRVMELGIDTPLLREGIKELDFVMNRLRCLPEGAVVADLSIARGFDYYTGTVYEGRFVDYPDHPPILVGGRYDNLVGKFMEQQLPGVGISLELTSIFTKLVKEGQIQPGRKTPTQALVAMPDMSSREIARQIADQLRERGLSVEVYHEPIDIDKQKAYAIEKGIPYLITPSAGNTREHCVRDMRSGIQKKIPSLRHWQPN
ncbi:MAG: histidine--tRNA ligase [Alphaproteobacteria bacterium]|nr:MAG: histidine--tRNA ligase [Alphaproteobacteria bacterium]